MNTLAYTLFAVFAGAHGGGSGALSRAPAGTFFGADAGRAVMLGADQDPAHDAWAFAARVGYQWRSGLAFDGRFDDLGVHSASGEGPMLLGSAGLRYGLPLVVMPYAEARVGAAFYGPHATPAAGAALGVSVPTLRHLAFEIDVRDWVAEVDDRVRHVPTLELGLAVGYGGH